MKSFVSKFSNEKVKSVSMSKKGSSSGDCCCGSSISDEKNEKDVNKK